MSTPSIGFLGGGRIARIFLAGWARAQSLPARIVVADPSAEALAKLQAQFPAIETPSDLATAAAQDVVFLATPPPVLTEAAGKAAAALKPSAILVSLAPKFTIAKLTVLLGGFARIARSNPNAPSIVGAGMNPVVFGVARPQPGFAVLLLLAYGVGHCALIVAAGVSVEKVQQVLDWNGRSAGARWLRRASGLLVLAGAGWLIWTARG